MIATIPQTAIDLILNAEGIDQPYDWPGGNSGITLGYGCDIGADPVSLSYWVGILTPGQIASLDTAKGITGLRAHELAGQFHQIKITPAQALQVFMQSSLPVEIQKTLTTFPGLEFMPPEVIGAMVSLVYNRGTSLAGDRRHEMLIIWQILQEFGTFSPDQRAAVQTEYMQKIALQFGKMKRLWVGQGLDGLLARRDAEADLILSAIHG